MHNAVQTAAVTIISYKPLNFARYVYIQHYGSYMPSSPLGVYISPWYHISLMFPHPLNKVREIVDSAMS